MKVSEAFDLFGTSTRGDAQTKHSRYLPRLDQSAAVAMEPLDGTAIRSIQAREVAQWVTTLEDNNDLTFAITSVGKRELKSIESNVMMLATDARVVFVKESGRSGDSRTVGHVRYPWINAIQWRARRGRFARAKIQLWMLEDFPVKHLGTWYHYIDVEFDGDVDTEAIALDLARRVAAHNLAHGAPAWAHDDLRAQAQLTELPTPDPGEEGLWASPATVACPRGAEYLGDSPPPAEWVGPNSPSATSGFIDEEADTPARQEASALIFKRILARGSKASSRRGAEKIEPLDLLLALSVDDDTPVSRLLAQHGADFESLDSHLTRHD